MEELIEASWRAESDESKGVLGQSVSNFQYFFKLNPTYRNIC